MPRRRRQGRWCCDTLDFSSLLCAPLRCCFGRPCVARCAEHAAQGWPARSHKDGADGKLEHSVLVELFKSSRKVMFRGLSGSRGQGAAVPAFSCDIIAHSTAGSTRARSTTVGRGGMTSRDFVTTNRSCRSLLVCNPALWRVAGAAFPSRALCGASMAAATGAVYFPTLPPPSLHVDGCGRGLVDVQLLWCHTVATSTSSVLCRGTASSAAVLSGRCGCALVLCVHGTRS